MGRGARLSGGSVNVLGRFAHNSPDEVLGALVRINLKMNFYNSTFKVRLNAKRLKGRKRLDVPGVRLRAGRRMNEWSKVRRKLSLDFASKGITSCELGYEGCWREKALGWAHGRKRRHLQGDELTALVILACNPCHDKIERLPEAKMCGIVTDVIANRRRAA